MSCRFDRFVQGSDNVLAVEVEHTVLVYPSVEIFTEGFASDGKVVAVDEVILQEEMKDLWVVKSKGGVCGNQVVRQCSVVSEITERLTRNTTKFVDIFHDIFATRLDVGKEGDPV